MSHRLPNLTGGRVIAALQRAGFVVLRVRGSHHFLRHPDGRTTLVPVHAGESIGRGLLTKILRNCGLDKEQFRALLK